MTDNTAPERGDTPIQEAALVAMEYLTQLGVCPTAVPDEREAAALRVVAVYAYEHPRLLRDLATRKPVGDGEVVLGLTREEAKWTAACLEPHSHNEHERAVSRKLRAALDQGDSDE